MIDVDAVQYAAHIGLCCIVACGLAWQMGVVSRAFSLHVFPLSTFSFLPPGFGSQLERDIQREHLNSASCLLLGSPTIVTILILPIQALISTSQRTIMSSAAPAPSSTEPLPAPGLSTSLIHVDDASGTAFLLMRSPSLTSCLLSDSRIARPTRTTRSPLPSSCPQHSGARSPLALPLRSFTLTNASYSSQIRPL